MRHIDDLQMQLDFLWEELQAYPDVLKVLKTAQSVRQASNAVLTGYEKPADQSNAVKNRRTDFGKGFYNKFSADSDEHKKVSRGYFVQFGAFRTKNNAKKRLYEIQSKGLDGLIEKFDGYYRVFDGYYDSVSDANMVAAKARQADFNVLIKERKV